MREVRVDGSAREFTYEATSGRLKKVKDAKGQEIHPTYSLDDKLNQITYVNAEHPTPNVSWAYADPATSAPDAHGRVRSRTDGTGTTTYAFHPFTGAASPGAGQPASIDGPYANDTLTYGYDELGRVVSRTLSGVTSTWAYDQQGRLQSQTDPIGTFTYAYAGSSGRVATVTYPNGQTSSYAYLPVAQDLHLQEIHHRKPDASTLNRFTYTYDKAGNILTWTQQTDANPANAYDFVYDRANQLTAATYRTTTPTPTVLKRYRYSYDAAGNRTAEQIDDVVTASTHDSMNRLISQQPGGALSFEGVTSEPATVTVGATPATVTAQNAFSGPAVVPSGTSQVAVQATDPSGNIRTNTYEVGQAASATSFAYDANRTLTSDAVRTYESDANDKLLAVKQGTNTLASFTYDGRLRRATKTASSTTTYVYDGHQSIEERSSTGSSTRYVFGPGLDRPLAQISGGGVGFYVADHLGSVVRRTDISGAPVLTLQYDPWGTPVQGAAASTYAYTGRVWDAEVGLYDYRNRILSPSLGRFLSEDPVATHDVSEYSYVRNRPTVLVDPLGTKECKKDDDCPSGTWNYASFEVSELSVSNPFKLRISFKANATCNEEIMGGRMGKKVEALDVDCSGMGLTLSVGGGPGVITGGFGGCCCRDDLVGDYRGAAINAGVGVAGGTFLSLLKKGGDWNQYMSITSGGLGLGKDVGAGISGYKCKVQ